MLLPTPNQEEIARFQYLYEQETGKKINLKDAQSQLTELVNMYYLLELHLTPQAEKLRSKKTKGTK